MVSTLSLCFINSTGIAVKLAYFTNPHMHLLLSSSLFVFYLSLPHKLQNLFSRRFFPENRSGHLTCGRVGSMFALISRWRVWKWVWRKDKEGGESVSRLCSVMFMPVLQVPIAVLMVAGLTWKWWVMNRQIQAAAGHLPTTTIGIQTATMSAKERDFLIAQLRTWHN